MEVCRYKTLAKVLNDIESVEDIAVKSKGFKHKSSAVVESPGLVREFEIDIVPLLQDVNPESDIELIDRVVDASEDGASFNLVRVKDTEDAIMLYVVSHLSEIKHGVRLYFESAEPAPNDSDVTLEDLTTIGDYHRLVYSNGCIVQINTVAWTIDLDDLPLEFIYDAKAILESNGVIDYNIPIAVYDSFSKAEWGSTPKHVVKELRDRLKITFNEHKGPLVFRLDRKEY